MELFIVVFQGGQSPARRCPSRGRNGVQGTARPTFAKDSGGNPRLRKAVTISGAAASIRWRAVACSERDAPGQRTGGEAPKPWQDPSEGSAFGALSPRRGASLYCHRGWSIPSYDGPPTAPVVPWGLPGQARPGEPAAPSQSPPHKLSPASHLRCGWLVCG